MNEKKIEAIKEIQELKRELKELREMEKEAEKAWLKAIYDCNHYPEWLFDENGRTLEQAKYAALDNLEAIEYERETKEYELESAIRRLDRLNRHDIKLSKGDSYYSRDPFEKIEHDGIIFGILL